MLCSCICIYLFVLVPRPVKNDEGTEEVDSAINTVYSNAAKLLLGLINVHAYWLLSRFVLVLLATTVAVKE